MPHLSFLKMAMLLPAVAALVAPAGGAVAQPSSPPLHDAAPTPFSGRWDLDLTRLPDSYGPPPKRVVYAFQPVDGGTWRISVDITAADDSVRHMAASFRPDGKAVPGEGDTSEADSAAIMIPAPNVLVMNLAKDGRPGSARVYTVAADGREMTESAAFINDKGKPVVRNFHFRHLP